MASANGVASGALVRGVRPADLQAREVIASHVQQGTLAGLDTPGTAAIGSRMAQRMGLGVGSQLTLISPKGAATALGSVPRVKSFTVVATFEVGMYEYDNSFVYIPLADAQAYFQLPDRVNAVEIMVAEPERITRLPARPAGPPRPGGRGWSTGSSSTRTSSRRCRSSAT